MRYAVCADAADLDLGLYAAERDFSLWKKLLAKVFHLKSDNKMSQEELLMLVDEVQQDGSIDKNEGELLKNAIDFPNSERRTF